MFRFLERSENTARLLEAGFRIALTRSKDSSSEWASVLTTAGVLTGYNAKYDIYDAPNVIDFLLRDRDNPSSVLSVVDNARMNARLVRTALTTEVWESVNENWMALNEAMKRPVKEKDLPDILSLIRQKSALVRGAVMGTMLRNDIYFFSQLGTAVERADNTARIIDVKYYTLLPSAKFVGSSLDNVQWETVLRSVSAHRAFRWLNEDEMTAAAIANFLILDARFPRSLLFCTTQIVANFGFLSLDYKARTRAHDMADAHRSKLKSCDIEKIFDIGLHEFIDGFIAENNAIGLQIENDYRFNA